MVEKIPNMDQAAKLEEEARPRASDKSGDLHTELQCEAEKIRAALGIIEGQAILTLVDKRN
jgi:hypothetical protein